MAIACLSACVDMPKPGDVIQTKEQAVKAAIEACFDAYGGVIPRHDWKAEYRDGVWALGQHSGFDTYGVYISARTGKPVNRCGLSTE